MKIQRWIPRWLVLAWLTACLTSTSSAQPPIPVRSEFGIDAGTALERSRPALAVDPAGTLLVVWEVEPDIRALRLDSEAFQLGSAFPVPSEPRGVKKRPAAAFVPLRPTRGIFVVAWDTRTEDYGYVATSIRARRFLNSGTPLGGEFLVATPDYGYVSSPAVAPAGDDGEFVVVWSNDGGGYGNILGRRFAATGSPIGARFSVSAAEGYSPAVASDAAGNFIVAWEGTRPPGQRIHRFDAQGRSLGGEILITEETNGLGSALSVQPGGAFTVAWKGLEGQIRARRFAAGGFPLGSDLQISDAPGSLPVLAPAVGDGFLALWQSDDGNLLTRAFDGAGRPEGPPVEVNEGALGSPARAALAGTGSAFAAVWPNAGGGPQASTLRGRLLRRAGPCRPTATRLCLSDDRFAVEMLWNTVLGTGGSGQGTEITADTGVFRFDNPQNVEIVLKVLDACQIANHNFWVFAGGLTNVAVGITVTDTKTGAAAFYSNPQDSPFRPIQDTRAFDTCP